MTTSLLLAFLAAAPGDLPTEMRWEDRGGSVEAFVWLRAGAWVSSGFEFEATRTDSVRVSSDGQGLASGGVDLGLTFADHFLVFVTAEYSATDDTNAQAAGAAIGYRDRSAPDASAGVPDEITIYAGALWGQFEVEESGFGDFDDAIGFRAGIAITYLLAPSLAVSAVGEYRLMEFEYQEDVLEGDTHAGGSGGWGGLALDLRF
jgi:hypothetical protein